MVHPTQANREPVTGSLAADQQMLNFEMRRAGQLEQATAYASDLGFHPLHAL